jgi:hypothetical protein
LQPFQIIYKQQKKRELMTSANRISTVTPQTPSDFSNFEIELDGGWVCVVHEMKAQEIEMTCPTCGGIDAESVLYTLDNEQYLYKGMCCDMFAVCHTN